MIQVLKEMVSEEVFWYGNAEMVTTINLGKKITNTIRYGPMLHQLQAAPSELSENQYVQKMILDELAANQEDIAVPGFVFGFKVQNADAAKTQLQRLEAYLRVMLENGYHYRPDLVSGLAQLGVLIGADACQYQAFSTR